MEERDASLLARIAWDITERDASISDVLRTCMLLGGETGSQQLRGWALKELKGYGVEDELPPYRTVGAQLKISAISGPYEVKGRPISPTQLPKEVQDTIGEEVHLRGPIADLERNAASSDKSLHITFGRSASVANAMSEQLGAFQQITSVYWDVPTSALHALVDQVRTVVTELTADLLAELPPNQAVPSRQATDRAASFAINGNNNVVQSTSDQASSTADTGDTATTAAEEGSRTLWQKLRRPGALVVGIAGVLAAIAGIGQWANWPWPW